MNTKFCDQQLFQNHWAKSSNEIWLASQLSLYRNLKTHLFPRLLKSSFLKDLTQMLEHSLKRNSYFKNAEFYFFEDLTPKNKQFLFDYLVSKPSYQSYQSGEGLLVFPKQHMFVEMNTTNHLVMHFIDNTNHLEKAWNKIANYEKELANQLEFAFSQKFGYLTSNVCRCGTAFHVRTLLHLPALIETEQIFEKIDFDYLEVESIDGSKEGFLGNLVFISNKQTIGMTEEQILKNMHSHTLNLILSEKKERTEHSEVFKNECSKAFGMLKHAIELDIFEALNLLSLCKMAAELNWLKNVSLETINELFISLSDEMLTHIDPSKKESEHLRAGVIKKKLESAQI